MSDQNTMQHWQNPSPPPAIEEVTEGEIVDPKVYAIDAVTGDVYHGDVTTMLTTAYNAKGRRVATPPPNTRRDGKDCILAINKCVRDRDTGELFSTWEPVNMDNVPPGPLPGEWKFVHLTSEV